MAHLSEACGKLAAQVAPLQLPLFPQARVLCTLRVREPQPRHAMHGHPLHLHACIYVWRCCDDLMYVHACAGRTGSLWVPGRVLRLNKHVHAYTRAAAYMHVHFSGDRTQGVQAQRESENSTFGALPACPRECARRTTLAAARGLFMNAQWVATAWAPARSTMRVRTSASVRPGIAAPPASCMHARCVVCHCNTLGVEHITFPLHTCHVLRGDQASAAPHSRLQQCMRASAPSFHFV